MRDKRTYLKVKIKSLAAEAQIIRKEEARARANGQRDLRLGLADHRRGIVRTEARHTLLAYGFLRGKTYKQMEAKTDAAPNWTKVRGMIEKYGTCWDGEEKWTEYQARKKDELARFDEWKKQ